MCVLHPAAYGVALGDCATHHIAKRLIRGCDHGGGESAAERTFERGGAVKQHGQRQLFQQMRLGRVIEHAKACGNIGLEWKPVQKLRAESMNGLHLEAARRFQSPRE